MTYISIQNFEIRRVPVSNRSDIIYLQFFINQSNFLSFPFFIKNIENEIMEKFKKVLLGKEVVINLNLEQTSEIDESNILQIKKEYILFDIMKKTGDNNTAVEQALRQETYLILENNSTLRNAIRQFINNN
jgi:hypothetical protein